MTKKQSRPGPGAPPLQANVAELRALAHPLRLRIMELFAEAPRTTKQVADLLGQPPTRLYHHVAALERAGLLKLKETRKNRGTVEKWYEGIARTMGTTTPGKKRSRSQAAGRRAVAMTVLEQSRQEVLAASSDPGGEPPILARLVMAAPPARIEEFRKRLYAFITEIQNADDCSAPAEPPEDLERWAMTMTFAPVWPRRGEREK